MIAFSGDHPVFQALFAAYPDAFLLVDTSGTVVLANPAAGELLGYSHEALVGLSVDTLVPDGIRPRHADFRHAYAQRPVPRPMGTHMDLVARRRDGSEVMVEIALSPLQALDEPYVVAAIRGIGAYPRVRQALKRARYAECVAQFGRHAVDTRDAQQLLRDAPAVAAAALEADSAALFVLEPDGLHFRVAGGVDLLPSEAEGTLLPSRSDTPAGYVMASGRSVVVPDYVAETRFKVPPAYLAHGLVCGLVVPLLERGRAVAALSVRSRRPQHFDEDETRLLESLANIVSATLQRAQSEDALRHAQRLESVGQLSGGVAHDFNNLLTVILGNVQVLEDRPGIQGDADARQSLEAAARAARRGSELTAKLLAFSRRQLLQPSRVDVGALLLSLADMLRRTLDQRINVRVDAQPDCPPCVADPGQLESALLNIAINARDAMPEGGTLTFRARGGVALPPALRAELGPPRRGSDAPPACVMIAVSDSGSGMPEAVKERAFEPFYTTKPAGRGTGLGLSTVYGFVRQSRGGVTLDSAPGQGTTVALYLPQAEAAPRGSALQSGRLAEVPVGLRVLVVEDEPEVLRVLQTLLGGFGCRVTPCSGGEQALFQLQQPGVKFDLLLSDIALGASMRGTELARRAHELRPELPVLLMSGYSAELLAGEADGAPPVHRLLHKPFTRDELALAIVAVIAPSRPPASDLRG